MPGLSSPAAARKPAMVAFAPHIKRPVPAEFPLKQPRFLLSEFVQKLESKTRPGSDHPRFKADLRQN